MLGNVIGTGAQFLLPGAALRNTTMGAAFLPQTIKGMAAQGAVVGALQPVGGGESRAANAGLGATAGALGSGIPVALSAAARGLVAPIRPFLESGREAAVASVLRGSASNPQGLLAAAPSSIPGVQRTLAEETLD